MKKDKTKIIIWICVAIAIVFNIFLCCLIITCANLLLNPELEPIENKFDEETYNSLFCDDVVWENEEKSIWVILDKDYSETDEPNVVVFKDDSVLYLESNWEKIHDNVCFVYLHSHFEKGQNKSLYYYNVYFYKDKIEVFESLSLNPNHIILKPVPRKAEHYIDFENTKTITQEIEEHEFPSDDRFIYSLNSDNSSYSISVKDNEITGEIIIPSEFNGLPITCIGKTHNNSYELLGFKDCYGISSITIPTTIKEIGEYAFCNCINVENINIPDSIERIYEGAFANCQNLKKIEYSKNCSIVPKKAFMGCLSLFECDLKGVVEKIEDSAFLNCISLNTISVNNVKEIGKMSFAFCYNLEEVDDVESLALIGEGIFQYCYNLKSFELSKNIEEIPKNAFYENRNLTTIYIGENIRRINDSSFYACLNISELHICNLYNYFNVVNDTDYVNLPYSFPKLNNGKLYVDGELATKLIIPEGITTIPSVFEKCDSIKEVVLPKSVTRVDPYAFYNCKSLESVICNENLNYIGNSAFAYCSELVFINLPESIDYIGSSAFYKCEKLDKTIYEKFIPMEQINQ